MVSRCRATLPNLVAELTDWSDYGKFIGFPFKVLGFAALLLLFLLAADQPRFLARVSLRRRSGNGCT